jgi:hypothetical protein
MINILTVICGPALLSAGENPNGSLGLALLLQLACTGTFIIAVIIFIFALICKIFKINS